MSRTLDLLSRAVTAQPIVTLLLLLVITISLGAGCALRAPQADHTAFLPSDSRVATASDKIDALFGRSGDTLTSTLLFRGNALTPDGLAQIDGVLVAAAGDPANEPSRHDPAVVEHKEVAWL